MKNKKIIVLVAVLAVITVALSLLLVKCGGKNTPDSGSTTTVAQTGAENETTQPSVTQTTSEATEETTEETTTATMSDGGAAGGGYNPDSTQPTEEVVEETEPVQVPAAGTKTNPYVEQAGKTPDSFTTVKIPAKGSIYYKLSGVKGMILTIEDTNAAIAYNGKTYAAKDGVVTLKFADDVQEPVALTMQNKASTAKVFTVNITAPVGTQTNPYTPEVQLPGNVATPQIAPGQAVYYSISGVGGAMLQIQAENVSVIYNEKTYTSKNGVLSVTFDSEDVTSFAVVNNGKKAASYVLNMELIPGTEANPYTPEVQLPSSVTTPMIDPGQTVYYSISGVGGAMLQIQAEYVSVIYNGNTYTAENGVLSVPFDQEDVTSFAIVNNSDQAATYVLEMEKILGTEGDPEILDQLGELSVQLATGDTYGYCYQWTATESGLFRLEMTSSDCCDVVVRNVTDGTEKTYSTDARTHSVTGLTSVMVGVREGEQILMKFVPSTDEAAAATVTTALVGTQADPIQEFYPGFAEEIPAGMTVYFQVYRLNNTTATVQGGDFTIDHGGNTYTTAEGPVSFAVVFVDMFTPSVFAITNNADTSAQCQMTIAYPVGSYNNPQVLETADLEQFTVTMEQGNDQGYYLTWTAPAVGTLSLQVQSITPVGTGHDVIVTTTAGYEMYMLSESQDGTLQIEVQPGDELTIHVSVEPDDEYNYPAAELVLQGDYTGKPGTQESPYEITVTQSPATASTLEKVPAGKSVYYNIYGASDTCLTIENAEAYIIYNGISYMPDANGVVTVNLAPTMGRAPATVQIGNSGTQAQLFDLNIEALPGSMSNPEVITSWENYVTAEITEADQDGIYYYTWTADKSGVFKVSIVSAPQDTRYNVVLSNNDTYMVCTLAEEGTVTEDATFVQVYVNQGDTVAIQVETLGTLDPNTGATVYPAASVTMSAYVSGSTPLDLTGETESDPYYLSVPQCNVPVPGNGVVYLSYNCYGQVLTVENENAYVVFDGVTYTPDADGVISFTFPEFEGMGRPMPIGFTLGNSGEYDTNIYISVMAAEGTYANPESITSLDSIQVSIAEGNEQGYYLTWTAAEAGTVSFRVDAITAGVSCDVALSSTGSYTMPLLSESTDGTVKMEVAAGDVVTVLVSVLPDDGFAYPAADITLNGVFTA